ncbi:anaerobic ribonucleoside-triphosphate reductase [Lacrimispora sphenoides]|uniref:anaerobic ribonucleoside-triphosphate reductase n=1 Tax=Lacrimispora sphenoides TaxID=29370 RepID=UPI0008BA6313|nr:anaerobic ribonucleoside-triphosphate reductase [Lacrimispora sphenoides]SEU10133.1 anaerobic ribonucleoside-triphosphate reductase [Lacrimispora sphenoides]
MKIIKRDGSKVDFDKSKIKKAILKAFIDVDGEESPYAKEKARDIANYIESLSKEMSVENIQDVVEEKLMSSNRKDVARAYIQYRLKRSLIRESNTTDKSILELLDGNSEYWNTENSNKNARLNTTIRDYTAGVVSKDLTERILLPKDIVEAHNAGIIHFHDEDYYMQRMHNCDLVNLEDMLQNGTVISETLIEKPHSFSTACNIATQIIAQVASSQYGGQSISLAHLAPFVDISRKSIRNDVIKERTVTGDDLDEEKINTTVKMRLAKEIKKGIQTIQYQVITLMTTNGQAPFLSVNMYLNEVKDSQTKEDLALIIEEVLKQRLQGVKNEVGVWITPAFPKLLYFLEEDNVCENSPYWYLTELAAKCTAKRMVPDYISEKIMLRNKIDKNGNGNAYPCMGCVESNEIITYKHKGKLYVESFKRMWTRLSDNFCAKRQFEDSEDYLYIDLDDVQIYDTEKGFVNTKRIIRNKSDKWVNVKLSHGRSLICTPDHPFHTERGRIRADSLKNTDTVNINSSQYFEESQLFDDDKAWLLGFILCDGCYDGHVSSSIAFDSENDIEAAYIERMKNCFDSKVEVVERHRGVKGKYKDLCSIGNVSDIIDYLSIKFEGLTKLRRHIPNEVFSWNYTAKLSFLAGMVDADGYINPTTHNGSVVQIGSTNKELALQQAALARALGMPAAVYQNHYSKKNPNAIRYRVEFAPSEELLTYIVSNKKVDNYIENGTDYHFYKSKVNSVEIINGMSDYSYDVTTDSDHFEVSGIYSHNCRSFLTPYVDENGNPKYYGRFNQGVVTISLPDIALSSNGDVETFWTIFEERMELCHKALRCRHERLMGTTSDVAPILWQNGALARLNKGEKIDKLLYGGYSTLSLGYGGLYECVKFMTEHSHTDNGIGKEFGLEVMRALNQKCNQWKAEEDIDYSIYGSPIESTTYKFAKCLKKRFGIIEGITDRDYITNSYHVPVFEAIDPFEKLALESEFQALSPGGAISYIECADLTNNTQAVLEVMKFIYDHIMYAELNTKSDYCQVCGYNGEIKIVDIDGSLDWECPNCGNRDHSKMNVSRRTCGYIGTNFWNPGRTDEMRSRYVHLDDHELKEGDCN